MVNITPETEFVESATIVPHDLRSVQASLSARSTALLERWTLTKQAALRHLVIYSGAFVGLTVGTATLLVARRQTVADGTARSGVSRRQAAISRLAWRRRSGMLGAAALYGTVCGSAMMLGHYAGGGVRQ